MAENPMPCCGYLPSEGHNGTCTFFGIDPGSQVETFASVIMWKDADAKAAYDTAIALRDRLVLMMAEGISKTEAEDVAIALKPINQAIANVVIAYSVPAILIKQKP